MKKITSFTAGGLLIGSVLLVHFVVGSTHIPAVPPMHQQVMNTLETATLKKSITEEFVDPLIEIPEAIQIEQSETFGVITTSLSLQTTPAGFIGSVTFDTVYAQKFSQKNQSGERILQYSELEEYISKNIYIQNNEILCSLNVTHQDVSAEEIMGNFETLSFLLDSSCEGDLENIRVENTLFSSGSVPFAHPLLVYTQNGMNRRSLYSGILSNSISFVSFPYDIAGNNIVDTDLDGIVDTEESIYGTSPTYADTDNDGINDYQEILRGFDPLIPYINSL